MGKKFIKDKQKLILIKNLVVFMVVRKLRLI